MSRKIIVLDRQTLWDIAIQEYGTVEAVFDLLSDNPSLTINTALIAGQQLIISSPVMNQDVYDYFKKNNLNPVSDVRDVSEITDGAFTDGFSSGFLI